MTSSSNLYLYHHFQIAGKHSLPLTWVTKVEPYVGNQSAQVITIQQLISLFTEDERRKKMEATMASWLRQKISQKRKSPSYVLFVDALITSQQITITRGKFGHKGKECWQNPLNKGKERVTKNIGQNHFKSDHKGKQHANITTEDTDSNTESLDKAFTMHVKVINNKEEANEAKFSVYLWIADSSATSHICTECNAFSNYQELPQKVVKELGDKPVTTCGKGSVTILSQIENQVTKIQLLKALYISETCDNLLLLGHICRSSG